MAKKSLNTQIMSKLKEVLDPEIGISIIDMGLVYDIKTGNLPITAKSKVNIIMTLTTIGCPLFSVIEREIQNRIQELGFKEKNIKIELTFDPPWTMERMSKKGRIMLGL